MSANLRMLLGLLGHTCMVAAIIVIGVGVYKTEKYNTALPVNHRYSEQHTFYDGPWLPMEFCFLGAAVLLVSAGRGDL